jgi:hypothetical protein
MRIAQMAPLYESVPPKYYGVRTNFKRHADLPGNFDGAVYSFLWRKAPQESQVDRHTGFVVEGLDDTIEAVRRAPELSRKRCLEVFEQCFSATRMVQDYVQIFERLIKTEEKLPEAA